MKRQSQSVIEQLQRGKRFMGTCPECSEDFSLANAILYSIDEAPPELALAAIRIAREKLKERKAECTKLLERMSTRAQKTAETVNLGKIVEKIVPSFSGFEHPPGDCRALFEPIDYVIFRGLTTRGVVDSLLFVDVKSGKARLKSHQQDIRSAVEDGAIEFAVIGEHSL